jgi:hypothetical protein
MIAKSIHGRSSDEINAALQRAMVDGYAPTLAIVFISIKQDRHALCETLHSKGIDILGATSSGEFINGHQDMGTTVILLLDLDPSCYTILFEDVNNRDLGEAATELAKNALRTFRKPGFILCSTGLSSKVEFLDGEVVVRSIEMVIGTQVNIFGGMAGDDMSFTGTYVFTYGKSTDVGIAALVVDEDRVSLHGMAISGWKPIGIFRTVTKSNEGWIYTIDDQPALDMYLKYLGKEAVDEEDKYKIFESIGIHYPFQVERETGEPVMRTPMQINREEKALMCDYDVPEGSKIRFSMPPDFDVVEKVIEQAQELKNESGAEAEALLIFSCAGRLSALGPLTNIENEGLYETWKAPMAGFFTYGEYGRALKGKQEFHSTTCCWVALKEK